MTQLVSTLQSNFQSFDEYVKSNCDLIKTLIDETDWKKSKCSCGLFKKNGYCHHVLGLSGKLKLVDFPEDAFSVVLEKKKRRGRNAAAALIYQPNIEAIQESDASIEEFENETPETAPEKVTKRGRTPKSKQPPQTAPEKVAKRGRPPKAKDTIVQPTPKPATITTKGSKKTVVPSPVPSPKPSTTKNTNSRKRTIEQDEPEIQPQKK